MVLKKSAPLLRRLSAALVLWPALLGGASHALPSTLGFTDGSLAGLYLAARAADSDRDFASAAAFYRSAYDADPDNMFLLERAVVLSAMSGQFGESARLAAPLSINSPRSGVANLILAVSRIEEGDFAGAKEMVEAGPDGILADLTNALLIAWAEFGQGEIDAALDTLAGLKGQELYEVFKHLNTGYIALASGRTQAAVEALRSAYEIDDGAARIAEAYTVALAVAGKRDEAAKVASSYLERFPDNRIMSRRLEELQAGGELRSEIADPVKGAAEALSGLGVTIGREGGQELAILYLRLALYLDPQNSGGLAALSLGSLLNAAGQSEAAIELMESIGEDQPFRALGLLRAAIALDGMETRDGVDTESEAEKAFRASIANNPDDQQAYIAFGNMLRGRERFAEAAEMYSRAIAMIEGEDENDWTLFYFRGIVYEQQKQWEKAEADFKTALELREDQPLVLNYLGYSWVDKGINLEEALDMIRKAVELRPEDGYIVDSLGWAYYRLGRYEEAVVELERAIEMRPNDPVINDHLGDAYFKVGRTLEAQFQWRHARDFGAKDEELKTILRKIAEGKLVAPESGGSTAGQGDPT